MPLLENHDISHFSAFKTPLRARYFFDIITRADIDQLHEIFLFARKESLPLLFLGGGTNCLFACDYFDGIVIRNRFAGYEISEKNNTKVARVNSGELAHTFSLKMYEEEIVTMLPWIGLPGTFGGATVGNAGCFGLEMADMFLESEILDLETGEIFRWEKSEMHYQYRESTLKGNPRFFVISTTIDLSPRGSEYEKYTPEDMRRIRREKQPVGFSCGSFFKNPGKKIGENTPSAGKLIDDAGLKGLRVGGVKVSTEHANFFINDEKAKWQDLIALRDIVKKTVREKYGIELEEEVRIIG